MMARLCDCEHDSVDVCLHNELNLFVTLNWQLECISIDGRQIQWKKKRKKRFNERMEE